MPEQRLGDLKVGQTVEVEVDAYPGKIFNGKIGSIDARVSAETRNVLVRGEVDNPARLLRPGMFANVSVLVGAPRTVVTVPRTAISFSLYGEFRLKSVVPDEKAGARRAEGRAALRAHRRHAGDRVAILEGVKPGERIVTEGQIKLQPGARVKIDPSALAGAADVAAEGVARWARSPTSSSGGRCWPPSSAC